MLRILFDLPNQFLEIDETYQHSGSEIELLEELSDEDMDTDEVIGVVVFDITDDVSEPLVVLLGTGHPDEVHLRK